MGKTKKLNPDTEQTRCDYGWRARITTRTCPSGPTSLNKRAKTTGKFEYAEISNEVENDFVQRARDCIRPITRVRQMLSLSIGRCDEIEHAYDNYNFAAVNSEINAFTTFLSNVIWRLERSFIFKSSVGSESTRRTNGCPRVNYELVSRLSTNFTSRPRSVLARDAVQRTSKRRSS